MCLSGSLAGISLRDSVLFRRPAVTNGIPISLREMKKSSILLVNVDCCML